ncbi:hypothetical protein JCM1841_005098 [Sporobolomyces salmonicolor]
MPNIFSIPIFFIVFREVVEAGIVVATLLSLVDNLSGQDEPQGEGGSPSAQQLLRKRMRWMIWAGALSGLGIAVCIGAAFIAVFFTTLSDLWSKSEDLWEGVFSLIACILIYVMGMGMLKIDRSQIKWKHKFAAAFNKELDGTLTARERREGRRGKWSLFILPFVTVLREGLEAVTFVGGVALGQPAKAIPLAAIVGLIVGFVVGFLIYLSGSRLNLSIFLVISTNILLLIGAGLLSKAVWFFQAYRFNKGVGADVEELGYGPGSFDVSGMVWHVTYGNPESTLHSQGWSIFNALLGWQNTATLGSILSYCFYWIAVMAALIRMKWMEGRTSIFGFHSDAGRRRLARTRKAQLEDASPASGSSAGSIDEKKDQGALEIEQDVVERPTLGRNGTIGVVGGEVDEIKEAGSP